MTTPLHRIHSLQFLAALQISQLPPLSEEIPEEATIRFSALHPLKPEERDTTFLWRQTLNIILLRHWETLKMCFRVLNTESKKGRPLSIKYNEEVISWPEYLLFHMGDKEEGCLDSVQKAFQRFIAVQSSLYPLVGLEVPSSPCAPLQLLLFQERFSSLAEAQRLVDFWEALCRIDPTLARIDLEYEKGISPSEILLKDAAKIRSWLLAPPSGIEIQLKEELITSRKLLDLTSARRLLALPKEIALFQNLEFLFLPAYLDTSNLRCLEPLSHLKAVICSQKGIPVYFSAAQMQESHALHLASESLYAILQLTKADVPVERATHLFLQSTLHAPGCRSNTLLHALFDPYQEPSAPKAHIEPILAALSPSISTSSFIPLIHYSVVYEGSQDQDLLKLTLQPFVALHQAAQESLCTLSRQISEIQDRREVDQIHLYALARLLLLKIEVEEITSWAQASQAFTFNFQAKLSQFRRQIADAKEIAEVSQPPLYGYDFDAFSTSHGYYPTGSLALFFNALIFQEPIGILQAFLSLSESDRALFIDKLSDPASFQQLITTYSLIGSKVLPTLTFQLLQNRSQPKPKPRDNVTPSCTTTIAIQEQILDCLSALYQMIEEKTAMLSPEQKKQFPQQLLEKRAEAIAPRLIPWGGESLEFLFEFIETLSP